MVSILSFYTTGAQAATLEYINSNFLKSTGYAYSYSSLATTFQSVIFANGGIDGIGSGL